MESNHLLIVSSEFPPGPGGIGQHAFDLARALQAKGNIVSVMSPADYATKSEIDTFDQEQPFSVIRYPRIGYRTYLNRIRMTLRYVNGRKINTVLLTGKFSLWTGWFIKKRFPAVKTICILHGSEVNLEKRSLRKFTHRSINKCDEIVAVSGFTASLLPDFIKEKRKVHIIPNGINIEFLSRPSINNNVLLKGDPKIITVGHVSNRKGQHRVIKALPEIIKKYPDLHYHIVGRPVKESTFAALADKLGVRDHVTFHGKVANHSDLQHYYRQCDAFMLLSENQPNGDVEGFGIVALEANFYGIPVVGARDCGVEDAVSEGKSGYLADGDDPKQIEAALTQCLLHKNEMKLSCSEWARRHEWNIIVEDFLTLCS